MNLKRIPHIYHNTKYARKLFEIVNDKYLEISKIYEAMHKFTEISELNGIMLDIKGENIGVSRKGRNDTEYREILMFEYLKINRFGNMIDMMEVLNQYFKEKVEIKELTAKLRVLTTANKIAVLEKISALKSAGVGILVQKEPYISDYSIEELQAMTLDEIAKIKLKEE